MITAPLGDQAVLCYFPDEAAAVRFAAAVRVAGPAWLYDVVPAYASVGVFFDPDRVAIADVVKWLEGVKYRPADAGRSPGTLHIIPVCYEMQLDLAGSSSTRG